MTGSSGERASVAVDGESVLRIGSLDEVDSLNPYIGLSDMSYVFYGLVYDSLFTIGNDLETVGNLASEWRIVPESDPELQASGEPYGSVWEYNITANAEWHDGEPFTVDDVVWNVDLNADNYNYMWAYQPYSFLMDYAEAVDDDTVRIHYYNRSTSEPSPVAYGDSIHIPMLPKHLLESQTPATIGFMWTGVYANSSYPIVGTGPFTGTENVWDEFVAREQITLVKNPNYHWGVDKGLEVQFDKIVISFYDDSTVLRAALEDGLVDVAQLSPTTYGELKEDIDAGLVDDVATYDGLKVNSYWTNVLFNMNDAGPNCARLDPAVREALAMATNKTYIAETFYHGYAEPGSTLISPIVEEWHCALDPSELFQYDLDIAAQHLEDAGYVFTPESQEVRVASADSLAVQEGWVLEDTPLVFDMLVRQGYPEEAEIAAYLESTFWQIGVDLSCRIVDEAVVPTEIYLYEYDTAIWYWSSDVDPNYMLFAQSKYAWNAWSDNLYFNPDYEQNYNASVAAVDPGDRKTYVDNCQRIHYDDVGYIILAYTDQTYAWRTDTFVGWGDWAEDPGRSLDACWGANPLLFDLVPISMAVNEPPANVTLAVPSEDIYVDQLATFTVSAVDMDKDALMIELDFGDGTAEGMSFLSNVSTTYEATFTHAYDADGDYQLMVTVDDQTGLPGHVVTYGPVTFSVLEDDIAPVTDISVEGVMGENEWYVSSVNVTLTASDEGGEVVATEYRLGLGLWMDYKGEFTLATEGSNRLDYRSNDTSGNVEADQTIFIRIDTEAPTLSVEVDPKQTSSDIAVVITFSDQPGSGVVRLTTSMDGSTNTSYIAADDIYYYQGLSDGEHTLTVTAYDEAGHSTTETVTFEIETSLFAMDGPAGPWIIVGMLLAIIAIISVAAFLLFSRWKAPPA